MTKKQLEQITSILNENEIEYANQFSKQIDLKNEQIVSQYGAKATMEISKSNDRLKQQLDGLQTEFTKDIQVTDKLIMANRNLKKELAMYILAGENAINKKIGPSKSKTEFKDKLDDLYSSYQLLENIDSMVDIIQTFHKKSLELINEQIDAMNDFNQTQFKLDLSSSTSLTKQKANQINDEQQDLNEKYLKQLNKAFQKQ